MRIVVYGNSGSGKSTLARSISANSKLEYLDLDTLAWTGGTPPERRPLEESHRHIASFNAAHPHWVIEGCYATLISHASQWATDLVFLNPGIEACLQNCRSRPWETHKYRSQEEQDKNLSMLLDWVSQYETRDDEYSYQEHKRLFDNFIKIKTELTSNAETRAFTNKLRTALSTSLE